MFYMEYVLVNYQATVTGMLLLCNERCAGLGVVLIVHSDGVAHYDYQLLQV